jgi:hypothetical protein
LTPRQDLFLREEYQIEPRGLLLAPEAFPEQPLGAVPRRGAPDPPGGRQSEAAVATTILHGDEREEGAVEALAAPEGTPEVARGAETLPRPQRRPLRGGGGAQAAIRFRPF